MNWSEHIPLVTLLAVVFSAGALLTQHHGIKKDLRGLIDKTIPRIHERLDDAHTWRVKHDAEQHTRRRLRTAGHGVPVRLDDESDHG